MKSQSAWVAVVWAMAACGGGAGPSTNSSCTPGATATCPCADGTTGAQVCNRGGTFDACRCVAADSGVDVPRPMDVAGPDATPEDLGAPDAVTPPDVVAPPDAAVAPDAEPCPAGQTRCGGACVDPQASPLHCGACDRACPAGQACDRGTCSAPPADCRMGGCPAMTYCDLGTGMCRPGCADDSHCPATERCDFSTRTCACGTGTHRCGARCASNAAPETCGASCAPCPGASNAAATCTDGRCGVACNTGFHTCAGACASDESPMTCGTRCDPCAAPTNGAATCEAGRCGVRCGAGFIRCSTGCCAVTGTMIPIPITASPRELNLSLGGGALHLFYLLSSGSVSAQGHHESPSTGVWREGAAARMLGAGLTHVAGTYTAWGALLACGSYESTSPTNPWQVRCSQRMGTSVTNFQPASGDAHTVGSLEVATGPRGQLGVLIRETARVGARMPTQWIASSISSAVDLLRPEIAAGVPSSVYFDSSDRPAAVAAAGAASCLQRYLLTSGVYGTAMLGSTCTAATQVSVSARPSTVSVAYATPTNAVMYIRNLLSLPITAEVVSPPSPSPVTALELHMDDSASPHVVFTRATSEVFYAGLIASGWAVSSVSDAARGALGSYPVVATDAARRPHVVFVSGAGVLDVTW